MHTKGYCSYAVLERTEESRDLISYQATVVAFGLIIAILLILALVCVMICTLFWSQKIRSKQSITSAS